MEQKMTEQTLTIHDLITGLIEREEWKHAHPDLRDYFSQRAELLCELFGCDVKRRANELDEECRANRAASRLRRRNDDDGEIDLTVFAVDGRQTNGLLMRCIHLVNQTLTPWSCSPEGMPPKIERDLRKTHGPALETNAEELRKVYREIIHDLLEYLFPSIGLKSFSESRLLFMGLPPERPDPDDYF
jgi:hypothetical protein